MNTRNFLNGGGEMGALMRAHDWTASGLGPPEGWPGPLKTAVRLILNTGHPMYVWWGPALLCFYNDAYRRTLGPERHPGTLGRPGREVWAEIWHLIGDQVAFVMAGEGSTWDENRVVPTTRFGRLEDIYWTYSYSPIHDDTVAGGVGGVLVVCAETTDVVLAARRRRAEIERQRMLFEQAPGFITILSGPDHVFEFVNAAYRRQFGDRGYIGRPVREAFPELAQQDFLRLLDRVFATGERFIATGVRFDLEPPDHPPDTRFLDFIYEPIVDEAGRVTGIFVEGHDVTRACRADMALRAHAARQAFLLRLEERLRDPMPPADAISIASEALGRHLGVDQVAYGEVDADGDGVVMANEWSEDGFASNAGPHRLADYGGGFADALRAGRTVAIADVRLDARTADPPSIAAFGRTSVTAVVNVPVVAAGRLVAILGVHSARPRDWSEDEVALAEDVARRMWTAAERARADASLRHAEERYLALFNGIEQGFCTIEMAFDADERPIDYRFLEVSPSFAPQTGIWDGAGRWMRDIAPDQDQHWFDVYGRVALTGEPARFESHSTPFGRWWDVYAFRISGPRRVGVLFRDITAKKRAEAALRESEERFRSFAETSTDTLWIVDADSGRLDYLSPAYERVWGEPRGGVVAGAGHWSARVHPDDRIIAAEGFRALKAGRRLNFEYRIVRPDGAIRHIHDAGFPILEEGRVIRLAGVAQDLTERRTIERALTESERRARSLMEGIPQLVWRAVEQGDWTWASRQWTDFTGQPEQASHGDGWLATLHPDDRERARAAWSRAAETGGFDVEHRIRRHDGSHVWFATRAMPVRDEAGVVVEWLGTSTEIDAMRDLQQRQGVLVSELQHRTRNLIGVVRSLVGKTIDEASSFDDFTDRFDMRLNALSRAQALLSAMSAGQTVTFDELVLSELNALGATGGDGGKVTLDGPTGVKLEAAAVQIFALALHELATNAVKYGAISTPGGHLAVRWVVEAEAGGRRLHVDWRETGVAIADGGGPSATGGFGRELIERALPYQLKAKTTYELGADGVHCTIAMPISPAT